MLENNHFSTFLTYFYAPKTTSSLFNLFWKVRELGIENYVFQIIQMAKKKSEKRRNVNNYYTPAKWTLIILFHLVTLWIDYF